MIVGKGFVFPHKKPEDAPLHSTAFILMHLGFMTEEEAIAQLRKECGLPPQKKTMVGSE